MNRTFLTSVPRLLVSAWKARRAAAGRKLPGLSFDRFGRCLAAREIRAQWRLTPGSLERLANPVSCVRYFEFDFAERGVSSVSGMAGAPPRLLDVSSPRLFPFWAAERMGHHVTMINPDTADIALSRRLVPYLRSRAGVDIVDGVDGTALPFPDNVFDAATSISVIEHVGEDGDMSMVDELVRVVRPGGTIVLTFPVKPLFENEFRAVDHYGTQPKDGPGGQYFFQRFYDQQAIAHRIVGRPGIREERRRYFVEDPPGWFAGYEQEWIRNGLTHTVRDPWFMAHHFRDGGAIHPADRMGVCGLVLRIDKPGVATK